MNLLEATQVVENANKVFILRLNSGVIIGSKISGSSDEDGLLFLDDPCFVTLVIDAKGETHTHMEPLIPTGLVKTTSGPINVDNIMMIWEASASYTVFYNRVMSKFNSDMNSVAAPKTDVTPVVETEKKSILELIKAENESSNVISVDFKNRKRIEEHEEGSENPDDGNDAA